ISRRTREVTAQIQNLLPLLTPSLSHTLSLSGSVSVLSLSAQLGQGTDCCLSLRSWDRGLLSLHSWDKGLLFLRSWDRGLLSLCVAGTGDCSLSAQLGQGTDLSAQLGQGTAV
ncbi:hypothetical protein AAFF_G00046500, partial [Aldrovandia affinis]